jgi:RHS repeat-associated protein
MKTIRLSILGLMAMTALVCRAQITSPGWFQSGVQPSVAQPLSNSTNQFQAEGLIMPLVQTNVPSAPIAEVVTPQIQALADGLQDNPELIFNWVHDHIKFVLYFGSKKGANLTLLEKSGNDFDQSALLVAMLQAAGYTNVQYQFGWQEIPYDDPYGIDYDLHHWWRLTLNNTNWTNTVNYVGGLIGTRGYPLIYYFNDGNTFDVQRTWVALTIGSTTYQLDPAFKVSEPVSALSGFSLTNAMGGAGTTISNALLTAAAGTDNGNYAQSLNEAALRSKLTGYTTNLLNYIQTNAPNASVQDVLGGWQITPANDSIDYSRHTWFYVDTGTMPILSWQYEPTNLMSTFKITFAGTNYQWFMPQLQGQRLALTFDNSGTAQLWQDDTLLASHATSGGGTTNVVLAVTHPVGSWNTANNTFVYNPTNFANMTVTNSYQRTNSTYAILYAFEPDWGWLQQRENKLDTYLQQGLTNGTRQVTSETLNIMGLNWMLQTAQAGEMTASQLGILPQYFHRIGRMAQETGRGYYVDVYMQFTGEFPSGGNDTAHINLSNSYFDLWSVFASAMEHGIIEQLQDTNLVAASTVKMLQIANTNGQAVYLASSTNWTTGYNVQSHLTAGTYDSGTLATIGNYISQGFYILLPQSGSNHVASTSGSWAGYGYEARQAVNGVADNSQMIISGGYHGGYSSDPTIPPDPVYVDTSGDDQSDYYDDTPVYTPPSTGGDPMDLANGTFQVENTDLSVGQAEPRGITLSRYYNGTRRFSNAGGMTGGWINNYSVTANQVAAPQAVLGGTTPEQAAAMLTATAAAIATYNGGYPNPKNWLTTALIAKWGIDQLTKSGVSVSLGKNTLQFVQQPNGVFTPPASSSATLTQSGSAYTLLMRHGNTFNFNASGCLTNIVDQYGQALSLTYNASNWVSTIKDWKNRTFTFTYSGSPSRLASVSDGTRTVSYGYSTAYNSQGDLTSFTDPEGKASTYAYDTNHQITATIDAQSRLVVSNLYDSQGHVTTQYTQGDTNKTWHIYWSGWHTMLFDPANDWTDYYYDDQGRLISVNDPLGYETDTYYDGQNHIVETVSPLGEVNQFIYDGNNNLIQKIDPLGFTNQLVYDSNNNLIKQIDPRGNVSTFDYNSQFSLTGQTNGAGDFVNFAYTTSGASAGTLASKTDSGGTTTFGYDSNGQVNSITYPNSLGSESFVNNSFGDVTSHTDGRGFVTTFSYNNRRQLTNSVAPTNLVTRVSFDAMGNMAGTTDARGNVSSFSWSATRHLLASTLPATSQGTPIVTNFYDSRDWLTKTLDPFQQPTLYTNDADGRLISQTDPLARTISFGYDGDGRETSTKNAAGEITRQTWDARSSLIKLTDGAGHTSLRAYDGVGNQIILTNRNGNVWQFHFDGANRLTNSVSPLGHSTIETFNHQSKLASVKDPAGNTATYGYDGKDRLTNRTDSVGTTLYSYDANDNRTNVVENGLTNTWTYDAYNRVSSYKDVYGNLIQYKYDASGNVTNLIYPGGKNVYYTFDSNNHLIQVKDWSGRVTTMTYDLAGKLTSITRPNGTYRTISYDVTGQATNILEQNAIGFPIALFRLNWNNAAEAQWEFTAPLPHNTNALPTRTMTYDADNRLATVDGNTVANDSDGNLVSAPLTNDTFFAYTYDARNRLLNAGGVTNAYDAMNNRVGQTYGTNTTVFVVNPNAKLPQVLERIKNGVTTYYIYGAGLQYQITETATATNTLTYHYDCRGSTIALTDDNGNVTDRMEYSAYATLTYRAGTSDTPFLFNGLYGVMTDPNGLLYMASRYYSPFLCRFINPDPTGFSGGLNFYAYANGNPISLVDPFGLSFWSVTGHFVEGAVIGAAITAAVIVAAPVVAAVGAEVLIASAATVGVEVSAGTAATVASATVTTGLWGAGAAGAVTTGADVIHNASAGNWDAVAFDAGTLTGGFVVGTTPDIVGDSSGGRTLTDDLHDLIGQQPSQAPNTWNLGDILDYEQANAYDPNYPNSSILNWLASGPTPFMSGTTATLTSSGLTSGFDLMTDQTPVDWLGNTLSTSPTTSSTGK